MKSEIETPQQDAKLRLERAAADLLAACKAIIAEVENAERIGDQCCVSTKASDCARAAVAKATE